MTANQKDAVPWNMEITAPTILSSTEPGMRDVKIPNEIPKTAAHNIAAKASCKVGRECCNTSGRTGT